jgi:hypothetical protein
MFGLAQRINPVSGFQVVATIALLGLGVGGIAMGYRTASTPLQDDTCAPYRYDQGAVDTRVFAYLDEGTTDPALVAVNTATDLFGAHPSEGSVVFPPSVDSLPEVRCVFDRVLAQVDRALRSRGLDADDLPNPSPGVRWRTVSAAPGSRDLASYPWNDAVIREEGVPTPSTFVLVRPDQDPSAFFKDATASALYLAGLDAQLAYDNNSKIGKRLRREMRDLIVTAPFNDRRITSASATLAGGRNPGTNGPNDPGRTHVLGPQGRGLVWSARHYDDMARLAAGLPAKRGIDLTGAVVGSGRSEMLVYVPAVSLAALRALTPAITTEGMQWPNGKNTIHVPPVVDRLGVDTSGVRFAEGAS